MSLHPVDDHLKDAEGHELYLPFQRDPPWAEGFAIHQDDICGARGGGREEWGVAREAGTDRQQACDKRFDNSTMSLRRPFCPFPAPPNPTN